MIKVDEGVVGDKVKVEVTCATGPVPCDVTWTNKVATCAFVPAVVGDYKVGRCMWCRLGCNQLYIHKSTNKK